MDCQFLRQICTLTKTFPKKMPKYLSSLMYQPLMKLCTGLGKKCALISQFFFTWFHLYLKHTNIRWCLNRTLLTLLTSSKTITAKKMENYPISTKSGVFLVFLLSNASPFFLYFDGLKISLAHKRWYWHYEKYFKHIFNKF